MDRNAATGLILISLILISYFYFFSPDEQPQPQETEQMETSQPAGDTVATTTAETASQPTTAPGAFQGLSGGEETFFDVENEDLRLQFSSKGFLKEIELVGFKAYSGEPLMLASNGNNRFKMMATYQGGQVDLYSLMYQGAVEKVNDTTQVVFRAQLDSSSWVRHTYRVPPGGYEIGYAFASGGVAFEGPISYAWDAFIPLQEKDMADSKRRTTINYYTLADSFDGLSESSDDEALISGGVKWMALKQKFFVSAIIADDAFAGGELRISEGVGESVVKVARTNLLIPPTSTSQAGFRYFFGPNDHNILGEVAPDFSRNLYLGWPPVLWVNKFVIIPIFNFLEKYISSYGIIIVLLVVIVKMVLSPLSYKSYLGMAKMKLLKPELDAIKKKNGDNMAQAQQDQMKLYQQAGVNPFSGCIPMVLQMPILFAMFYFFPVSIQLRQQPFLWAEDLSTYDSFLSLPFTIPMYGSHVSLFVLLMTASTIVYTWQNNQISSVQGPMKSFSYIMPLFVMVWLNSFSAGLSFYYFVSNLVTFGQQAFIRRFVNEDKILKIMDENKKKAATGKGKKSKFMTKLGDAMKASEEARKKGKK